MKLPQVFTRASGSRQGDRERDEGREAFQRLGDRDRVRLTSALLYDCRYVESLNRHAVGGALRAAWDTEPFLDGIRLGSFVSAATAAMPDETRWGFGEIAHEWGDLMMAPSERRRLDGLSFPLRVYRGGVGDPRLLATGLSWTTDPEIARFHAEAWPRRWGVEGRAIVLHASVEHADVAALFDDRREAEVLLPDGVPFDRVSVDETEPGVDIDAGGADRARRRQDGAFRRKPLRNRMRVAREPENTAHPP